MHVNWILHGFCAPQNCPLPVVKNALKIGQTQPHIDTAIYYRRSRCSTPSFAFFLPPCQSSALQIRMRVHRRQWHCIPNQQPKGANAGWHLRQAYLVLFSVDSDIFLEKWPLNDQRGMLKRYYPIHPFIYISCPLAVPHDLRLPPPLSPSQINGQTRKPRPNERTKTNYQWKRPRKERVQPKEKKKRLTKRLETRPGVRVRLPQRHFVPNK